MIPNCLSVLSSLLRGNFGGTLLHCGTASFSGGKQAGLGLQSSAAYRAMVDSPAGSHRGSKDFHSQERQEVKEMGKYLRKVPHYLS